MNQSSQNFDEVIIDVLSKNPNYMFESAWLEHGSFMMWLVQALKPRIYVELGTHFGYSYFAACQAISECKLNTRAFAVDTWEGDVQAGIYGSEVFDKVSDYNSKNYANFSTLLKMNFLEALDFIEDNSVDLLHIDGFHSYEAVFTDFHSWRSKLSTRAIVLFHDTNVFAEGFGVYKFWNEVKSEYPNYEFFHGHGLGILKYGNEPTAVDFLFEKAVSNFDGDVFRELISSIAAGKTIEFQLAQKDKIIEMYYLKLMREVDLNKQNSEAIKVLNQVISDIRSSYFWRLLWPLRAIKAVLNRKK